MALKGNLSEVKQGISKAEKNAANGVAPLDDKASVLFQNGYRLYSPTPSMGGISAWVTSYNYVIGNLVSNGGVTYRCKIAHASGTFATDLTAVKWITDAFPLKGNLVVGNGGTGFTTTSDVLEHPDFGGLYKGKLNTIFGIDAGLVIASASFDTFFGNQAGISTTSGDQNTYIGAYSGKSNTTGYHNTAVGAGAMQSNVTGFYNCYFGTDCGLSDDGGWSNTVMGTSSGVGSGSNNTVVGSTSGSPLTNEGDSNTWIGYGVANKNTTGHSNTFIGFETGYYNTTGYNNTFSGFYAGFNNTIGNGNTFIGNLAGTANTSGDANVGIGDSSLLGNTTGTFNVAVGKSALKGNIGGTGNIGIGYFALNANLSGGYNVGIGHQALFAATSSDNVGIGFQAGLALTSGLKCTFIGNSTNTSLASAVNSMALGYGAIVAASNTVQIGNSAVTSVLTHGSFEAQDIADGFICKSPDGTRYKITVANGGTIAIAAA